MLAARQPRRPAAVTPDSTRPMPAPAVLATVLFALTVATAGAQTIEYSDMDRIVAEPETRSARQAVLAAKSAEDALALCASFADSSSLDHLAREHLLVHCAVSMANRPASPATQSWLAELAERPVTAWVAHRHSGHSTPVPAFDPGAAARFALKQRARAEAQRGKLRADAPMSALRAALRTDAALGKTVVAAAQATGDARALRDVLEHGDTESRERALAAAATLPDAAAGLDVLRVGVDIPALSDRALYRMAEMAAADPARIDALLPYLDHSRVALAAGAALGTLDRPDLARALVTQLDQSVSREAAAARVLALHMIRDPRALDELRLWSERDGPWPELRRKVRATYFGADR